MVAAAMRIEPSATFQDDIRNCASLIGRLKADDALPCIVRSGPKLEAAMERPSDLYAVRRDQPVIEASCKFDAKGNTFDNLTSPAQQLVIGVFAEWRCPV